MLFQVSVFADGTKTLQASDTSENRMQLMPYFSWFAMYDCPDDYRLNIHVKEAGEKIYLGFGNINDNSGNLKHDVFFRIKDPLGNVVFGPDTIPYSGAGFINSFQEAVSGPQNINPAGYVPLIFEPATSGDFIVEFSFARTGGALVVKTPEEQIYQIGYGLFGPAFTDSLICADVAYIPDSSSLFTGCSGYLPSSFAGKIALIDRGSCFFSTKVLKAQEAGAVAVIVVNNNPNEGVMSMSSGDSITASLITIPSCFITWGNGQDIKQWLQQGDVHVCFGDSSYGVERRMFRYFDVSVSNATGEIIDGRLWSKAWQLSTVPFEGSPDPFADPFIGKVFVYTVDSMVTSFDFNGMKPFVFTMSANSNGCFATGDLVNDRKSTGGLHILPQFKIFLSPPDSVVFPTGSTGKLIEPISITNCPPGPYCVKINVTKRGRARLRIDLDNTPGYQPQGEDVEIISYITEGENCLFWDGKSYTGNSIPTPANLNIQLQYLSGETHTPLFDIESNDSGFVITVERPFNPYYTPSQFWDDTNIPDGTSELNGCTGTSGGCHAWNDSINCSGSMPCSLGDQKTINTWWYASMLDTSFVIHFDFLKTNIGIQNVSCFGLNDASIEIVPSGGAIPYSISWVNFSYDNLFAIDSLIAGWYAFSVSDDFNCSVSDSVFISQPEELIINIDSSINNLCYYDSLGQIFVSASGGTIPYTYFTSETSSVTGIFSNLPAGTFTLLIHDQNNCKDSTVVEITSPPEIITIIDSIITPKCFGDTNGAIYTSTSGGIGILQFQWNTNNTTENINNLLPGTFYLTTTDENNCKKISEITIPAVEELSITIDSIAHNKCNKITGGIYTSTAGGTAPFSYNWTNSVSHIDDATGLIAGYYSLTVTDSYSCIADTENIRILQYYQELSDIKTTIEKSCKGQCTGQSKVLITGGIAPFNVQWSNGNTGINANALCPGNYSVSVTDRNECIDSASVSIDEYSSAVEINSLYKEDSKCPDICSGNIHVRASGGIRPYTVKLNGEKKDSVLHKLCRGNYQITINDSVGCSVSDSLYIYDFLLPDNELPNIITPNDDGFNDQFIYKTSCEFPLILEIFNRWGNLIYYQEAINITWDGTTASGMKVSPGTYYYIIKAKNTNTKFIKKGVLQVM